MMNWRKVIQLTLVHVAVSITVVPVTSTLNRIMISDMKMSATLVAFLVALPYLLSPLQVPVGNWADTHPIWNRYRTPWILIGGLVAGAGSYMTAHTAYWMQDNFLLGFGAAIFFFTIWGVGVNVASVSYLSLLAELSTEPDPQADPQINTAQRKANWRNRTVGIMFTVMILSTILISTLLKRMLVDYSPTALFTAFGVVWMISTALILLGTVDLEPAMTQGQQAKRNTATNPMSSIRVLINNPVAWRFFWYLVLVLISIHAQDVLLEPFGADALGMDVSATSGLTRMWGMGFLVAILGSIPLVKRIGKKSSANIGAGVAALAFALISITGLMGQISAFSWSIFLLGMGGGLMTLSNLSFMLDMTVPQAAGLYIGAWGVANFAGQAVGGIVSGILRDVVYAVTGNLLFGYVSVFAIEIVGLLVAIWMFRSIHVDEFREQAEINLADVLALASD